MEKSTIYMAFLHIYVNLPEGTSEDPDLPQSGPDEFGPVNNICMHLVPTLGKTNTISKSTHSMISIRTIYNTCFTHIDYMDIW